MIQLALALACIGRIIVSPGTGRVKHLNVDEEKEEGCDAGDLQDVVIIVVVLAFVVAVVVVEYETDDDTEGHADDDEQDENATHQPPGECEPLLRPDYFAVDFRQTSGIVDDLRWQ